MSENEYSDIHYSDTAVLMNLPQDPHTIELQEAPSGDMYAMPQISAKGKKKVKTGSVKVETEEEKTKTHSTPPKQRKTAKKQEVSIPESNNILPSSVSSLLFKILR